MPRAKITRGAPNRVLARASWRLSAWTGAVLRPARLVGPRYFRTSSSISSCGIRGGPGLGGTARPPA
jgi:hypothetical protein